MATAGTAALSVLVLTFQPESAATSLWLLRGQMFLIGLAVSTAFVPLQTSMFTRISKADTGHASAIFNTARQVATAVFTAILSTIVAGVAGPQLTGFHDAYLAAAAGAALASVAAFTLIHTSDAAPSMVRPNARARTAVRT
jgi:sugar phosphate permease